VAAFPGAERQRRQQQAKVAANDPAASESTQRLALGADYLAACTSTNSTPATSTWTGQMSCIAEGCECQT
jgi:hypothetical protein